MTLLRCALVFLSFSVAVSIRKQILATRSHSQITVDDMCTSASTNLQNQVDFLDAGCIEGDEQCLDQTDSLGVSFRLIHEMADSFKVPCLDLNVGEASRSSAQFAVTADSRFVIKLIDPKEMDTLQGLIEDGKYKNHLESHTSLFLPFLYLITDDAKLPLVIMHNFHTDFAETAKGVFQDTEYEKEKYDVKPAQCKHSVERAPLMGRLLQEHWEPVKDPALSCSRGAGSICWTHIELMLSNDLEFLADSRRIDGLGRKMHYIDYSLIFLTATASGEHYPAVGLELPPNCAVSVHNDKTTLICVHVVDYLVEKTWKRKLESYWKDGKFEDYGEAVQDLLHCTGEMHFEDGEKDCKEYLDIGHTYLMENLQMGTTVHITDSTSTMLAATKLARTRYPDGYVLGKVGRVRATGRPMQLEAFAMHPNSHPDMAEAALSYECGFRQMLVSVPKAGKMCLPVDTLTQRTADVAAMNAVQVGQKVLIMYDQADLIRLCRDAGLEDEDDDARQFAAGTHVLVMEKWDDDGTVLVRLPRQGTVWVPVEAIVDIVVKPKRPPWIVRPAPPVFAGPLMKVSGYMVKSWALRWVEISKGVLRWWTSPDDAKTLPPKGQLILADVVLTNFNGHSSRFVLTGTSEGRGRKTYKFDADVERALLTSTALSKGGYFDLSESDQNIPATAWMRAIRSQDQKKRRTITKSRSSPKLAPDRTWPSQGPPVMGSPTVM